MFYREPEKIISATVLYSAGTHARGKKNVFVVLKIKGERARARAHWELMP